MAIYRAQDGSLRFHDTVVQEVGGWTVTRTRGATRRMNSYESAITQQRTVTEHEQDGFRLRRTMLGSYDTHRQGAPVRHRDTGMIGIFTHIKSPLADTTMCVRYHDTKPSYEGSILEFEEIVGHTTDEARERIWKLYELCAPPSRRAHEHITRALLRRYLDEQPYDL